MSNKGVLRDPGQTTDLLGFGQVSRNSRGPFERGKSAEQQLSVSGEVGGVKCRKSLHFEAKKNFDLPLNCSKSILVIVIEDLILLEYSPAQCIKCIYRGIAWSIPLNGEAVATVLGIHDCEFSHSD